MKKQAWGEVFESETNTGRITTIIHFFPSIASEKLLLPHQTKIFTVKATVVDHDVIMIMYFLPSSQAFFHSSVTSSPIDHSISSSPAMPSKATAGVALAAGAYAATAFLAPSQVTQQPTPATLQGQRHVRQPQTTTSLATGAVALGMAGVAVASTQARASRARAQVVRQATSVAEKVFTKMPASVKPGVVTGHFLANQI